MKNSTTDPQSLLSARRRSTEPANSVWLPGSVRQHASPSPLFNNTQTTALLQSIYCSSNMWIYTNQHDQLIKPTNIQHTTQRVYSHTAYKFLGEWQRISQDQFSHTISAFSLISQNASDLSSHGKASYQHTAPLILNHSQRSQDQFFMRPAD